MPAELGFAEDQDAGGDERSACRPREDARQTAQTWPSAALRELPKHLTGHQFKGVCVTGVPLVALKKIILFPTLTSEAPLLVPTPNKFLSMVDLPITIPVDGPSAKMPKPAVLFEEITRSTTILIPGPPLWVDATIP